MYRIELEDCYQRFLPTGYLDLYNMLFQQLSLLIQFALRHSTNIVFLIYYIDYKVINFGYTRDF